jgi:hypothetical protein
MIELDTINTQLARTLPVAGDGPGNQHCTAIKFSIEQFHGGGKVVFLSGLNQV